MQCERKSINSNKATKKKQVKIINEASKNYSTEVLKNLGSELLSDMIMLYNTVGLNINKIIENRCMISKPNNSPAFRVTIQATSVC